MHEPVETKSRWRFVLAAVAAGGLVTLAAPAAQQEQVPDPAPSEGAKAEVAAPPRGPYEAYDRGLYDQALQAFVDRQVERPEDPELLLNIGSAHYKMRDYAAAEEAFVEAAMEGDAGVRAQALYGLGNTAYRQGRLEEAVERYRAVLELDPDDEDAKFNLEFVRDEIRRRHEEAQKRQQEQQQGQQQEQQQEQQQGEQQGEQQDRESEAQPEAAADRDGDGLADETERSGANPTDPEDPDSDDDGLLDGEEDRNRNGQLDEGETDPNRADSDGDGIPDGAEEREDAGATEATAGEELEGMTEEEAERYLQALEEGRPHHRPPEPGRRLRVEKDW